MRVLAILLTAILLGGCQMSRVGTIHQSSEAMYPLASDAVAPDATQLRRDILIVIDGTGNDAISRTNAVKLYEMAEVTGALSEAAAGEPPRELVTYYANGVGSEKFEWVGQATGQGLEKDVREAYRFLTQTYRPGDRILLVGFSRGAFAQRVLAGLVAVAGIPDFSGADWDRKKRRLAIHEIWNRYETRRGKDEDVVDHAQRRRRAIAELDLFAGEEERRFENSNFIDVMAIWDTVAALGAPDRSSDPREPVPTYWVTNCNVGRVYHALALDDNRVYSFTPVLADMDEPESCPDFLAAPRAAFEAQLPAEVGAEPVREVWFAGAHSDVGGTYERDGVIDGRMSSVSLRWMLERLKTHGLFARMPLDWVPEDVAGPIHDAEVGSLPQRALYRHFRPLFKWYADKNPPARPTFHISVFDRLAQQRAIDARYDAHCIGADGSPPRADKPLLCSRNLLWGWFPAMTGGAANPAGDGPCLVPVYSAEQRRRWEAGERALGAFDWTLAPGQQCVEIECRAGEVFDLRTRTDCRPLATRALLPPRRVGSAG